MAYTENSIIGSLANHSLWGAFSGALASGAGSLVSHNLPTKTVPLLTNVVGGSIGGALLGGSSRIIQQAVFRFTNVKEDPLGNALIAIISIAAICFAVVKTDAMSLLGRVSNFQFRTNEIGLLGLGCIISEMMQSRYQSFSLTKAKKGSNLQKDQERSTKNSGSGVSPSPMREVLLEEIREVTKLSSQELEKIWKSVQKLQGDLASLNDPGSTYAQSAVSLLFVLGMLLGAMEEKDQAHLIFKLGLKDFTANQVHRGINQILQELDSIKDPTIHIANALTGPNHVIGSKSKQFEKYSELIKGLYHAESFKTDKEAINKWIERKTIGQIKDAVEDVGLETVTLINTLYFKGMWESQFDKSRSFSGTFTTSSNAKVQNIKYMIQNKSYQCYVGVTPGKINFKMVEIPYKIESGKPFTYRIFLPDDPTKIEEFEQELTYEFIEKCTQRARKRELILKIPGLDISAYNKEMLEGLRALNYLPSKVSLPVFSGGYMLSAIKQKCVAKVDEEGTAAAAATIAFAEKSMSFPLEFNVNHAFIAQISRENHTYFQFGMKGSDGLVPFE